MSEAIVVKASALPSPLILVKSEFLEALGLTEVKIGALSVKDAASAQVAATLLNELTTAGVMLERARVALKQPFIDQGRAIDATAEVPKARIDSSKRKLKFQLSQWEQLEEARIAEEKRAQQAELARLEAEKAKQDAEAARKAELALAAAKAAPVDELEEDELEFDAPPAPEKTEIERKIEAIKYAPAVAAPKPSGVRSTLILQLKVDSIEKLPDNYVIRTANERLLRETYCKGWKEGDDIPQVPGCTFTTIRGIASTGRSTEPEKF